MASAGTRGETEKLSETAHPPTLLRAQGLLSSCGKMGVTVNFD